MRHKLDIYDNGHVQWHGVDTGKTKVVAHNVEKKIIALKIAGHKYWSCREQAYARARFNVYKYRFIGPFPKSRMFVKGITIEIDSLDGFLDWPVRGSE